MHFLGKKRQVADACRQPALRYKIVKQSSGGKPSTASATFLEIIIR